MWPVCPTQVPSSPQQASPGSWLPALGEGTQAQREQASHGICSLSFWTKWPA